MISKTEMLDAMEPVSYEITEVLHSWVKNEGNNLQGFMDNPHGHANHNPYIILDYGKLQARLNLLRDVEESLFVVTEYKRGSDGYTRSMYETALENTSLDLMKRLLDWLIKRFGDMTKFIQSNGNVDGSVPAQEYAAMVTFNQPKFLAEYSMYQKAIHGCKVAVQYKTEQKELAKQAAAPPPPPSEAPEDPIGTTPEEPVEEQTP